MSPKTYFSPAKRMRTYFRSGSVFDAPKGGWADAVFDVVSLRYLVEDASFVLEGAPSNG
jgi:hypothetical protein